MARQKVDKVAESFKSGGQGFDLEKMTALIREQGFVLSDTKIRNLFQAADQDNSGCVDSKEVEKILKFLETADFQDSGSIGPSPSEPTDNTEAAKQMSEQLVQQRQQMDELVSE